MQPAARLLKKVSNVDNKQLAALTQMQGAQRNNRQQEALKYLDQGYHWLAQAGLSSDFHQQKSYLLQSFDSFSLALRYHRQASEPYLGLACVMMLSEQIPKARAYLNKVLELEPQHSEALRLGQRLKQDPAGQASAPEPKMPLRTQPVSQQTSQQELEQSQDDDFEAQYDQAELTLQQLTNALQKRLPELGVTLEPAVYQRTQKYLANYLNQIDSLKQQIQAIEVELDTQHLRNQIRPLESSLQGVLNAQARSLSLIELNTFILKQTEQVVQLKQRLIREPEVLSATDVNAQLEAFLDHSDRIADSIDEHEAQADPIAELVSAYEQFVNKFEQLEELAEDTLADLN